MHQPSPGQRALRKGRVSLENAAYFITTCTADQRSVFTHAESANIAIGALRWLREADRIWVLGYVIMPEHVHLMLVLQPGVTLARVMQVWKGYTARSLHRQCGIPSPVWQPGYYDHGIRDPEDLRTRLQYVHENPVRRELVQAPEEYEFSTAHASRRGDVDA